MMVEYADVDGFVIHDLRNRELAYTLSSANFSSGPEPRLVAELRPSAHGSVNRTRWYGPRLLELVGLCNDGEPVSTAKALDELRRVFALDGADQQFRFRPLGDEHDYFCSVRQNSKFDAPLAGYKQTVRWGITLEAPDPRYYGVDLLTQTGEPSVAGGIVCRNPGTFPTPATLTFLGPGRLTALYNALTGQRIVFKGGVTVAAASTLVADTKARTVTVDGVAQPWLIDAGPTSWWEIAAGDNQIVPEGTDFTLAAQFSASWREARI